ncbi:DNA polymerase Y family protein [Cellulomonas sp. NPDC089187]|uniref:DNA polymerase Y family protein n=1 Tax=Cellulomonas sp. NPDC089187 TaxID=3154970 RepID=UPI0034225565
MSAASQERGTRTTVVWTPDWPVVAALVATGTPLHHPAAVLAGARVHTVSALARREGVRRGMRRRQAQAVCPELVLLPADEDRDARLFEPVAVAVETVVPGIEVLRPGLLLLPAGGAARFHGTEDLLAERLVSAVADHTGHECQVGTADGLLAALVAARAEQRVPVGESAAFLAPRPVSELLAAAVQDERPVAALIDLLRRLGLRTLGDLARLDGPQVYARFGEWGSWAWTLARGDDLRPPARRRPEADLEVSSAVDPPAHRVDTATFAGRRLAEELHTLLTSHAVSCGRLRITARTDTGEDLTRTWRTDTGGLGGLTAARITDRIRWQLDGWLTAGALSRPVDDDADQREPVGIVRLTVTAEDVAAAGAEQGRLWGGSSGGDLRAHRALDRVQGLLGGDGVLTAVVQGGRDVRDQVHLRPWGAQQEVARPADRPWPGRLPAPAPATVPEEPAPVQVLDAAGAPVVLGARMVLSAPPALVRTRTTDHRIASWAGPWPLAERWWQDAGPRVRVHLQATLMDGRALLLAAHQHGWTCEAIYD